MGTRLEEHPVFTSIEMTSLVKAPIDVSKDSVFRWARVLFISS